MSNIEVIGAGFGRTGTHSMRMALNHLGYKTYHMIEAIQNPARNDYVIWGAMMRGEPVDEGLVEKVFLVFSFPFPFLFPVFSLLFFSTFSCSRRLLGLS